MVSVRKLRELYYTEPFRPFWLRLKDGRAVRVAQRTLYAFAGRRISVIQMNGAMELLDRRQVEGVEIKRKARK